MQFSPSPWLSGIVKHYLIVSAESTSFMKVRLFSDGNPGIVFHFGDPLKQTAAGELPVGLHSYPAATYQPRSFLYGQINQYNDWLSEGRLDMLVVVLQPTGLSSLLQISAHELNDKLVKLADLYGQEAIDLEEQVLNTYAARFDHPGVDPVYAAIRTVEDFFFKKMGAFPGPDPFVSGALQVMVDSRGLVRMEDLLRKIPVTERQLERKFKTVVGTSPKKMADIIKFQYFLKLLQQHPPTENLSDVVYEGGYYDQAHLNNYFKKMVGLTPRQYKASPHLLAVNFMQLPG